MRPSLPLVLVVASCVLTTACRTTRDADAFEIDSLATVSGSFWGSQGVNGDSGEASVGQLSGVYLVLMALSEDPADNQGPLGNSLLGIGSREHERDLSGWAESGRFVSRARDSWPECVTTDASGVLYDECEYGFAGDDGSVSFMLDGSYTWSDSSATADLHYDFSLSSSEVSLDWLLDWGMDIEWTDTTLDGKFDINYAYGVALGGLPPLGARTFTLDGTIDNLTAADDCDDGPVAGTLDWTSTRQEGIDPPESKHVTIEWLECGLAEITL